MARPNTAAVRLLAGSREPVLVATTANITLSGLQTIDAVALAAGDRVLVKDQANATENGIYEASTGTWYRAADARNSRAINQGITVRAQLGTAGGGKVYAFDTLDPNIGEDDIDVILHMSEQAAIEIAALAAQVAALPSGWRLTNFRGGNTNSVDVDYSMDLQADSISFFNPNTGAVGGKALGAVATNLACDIRTMAVNGRDQVAAFSGGDPNTTPDPILPDNIWFYFTLHPSGTVGTLASKTGPLATNAITGLIGPALQGGHTTYCPAFPVVISDRDGLRHDTRQGDEGSRVVFLASISGDVMTVTSWTGPALLAVGKRVRPDPILGSSTIPNNTLITAQLSSAEGGGALGKTGVYQLSTTEPTPAALDNWQATTPFLAQFVVKGNKARFSGTILDVLDPFMGLDNTSTQGSTSSYDWPYHLWIPRDGDDFCLTLDPEISAEEVTPGDEDGLTTSGFFVTWRRVTEPNYGNDLFLSDYAYGSLNRPTANNLTPDFPVRPDMVLAMTWLQGGGVTYSTTTVMGVRWYTFPIW